MVEKDIERVSDGELTELIASAERFLEVLPTAQMTRCFVSVARELQRLRRAPPPADRNAVVEEAAPTPDPAVMRDYIVRLTAFFMDNPQWTSLAEEAREYVGALEAK